MFDEPTQRINCNIKQWEKQFSFTFHFGDGQSMAEKQSFISMLSVEYV